ncbi:proline oxidase PrnD [Venturia nashicola]|uniref:Proline dehydrogenase n=1 Tax=Venturia nashicola TaxID=86259 RepID=A0A4Z1NRV4_9PEZI|nr:proline oxidase PrnD [Venturia nashicola]TLD23436.1 proline oxidase PrnD [Venturia nashicola]
MQSRMQRTTIRRLSPSALSRASCCRRHVHAGKQYKAPVTITSETPLSYDAPKTKDLSHLSCLPTSSVLRTYLITAVSSNAPLRNAVFLLLRKMLDSNSMILNPEKNKALRWIFKRTFYAQFCAGENKQEVQKSVEKMKAMGYTGAVLEYALEVLETDKASAADTASEIATWKKGMLDTVEVATKGDFIGLKWSGIGRQALENLKNNSAPPTPEMLAAIHEVCDLAFQKGLYFLPGAEEEHVNYGLDAWTLDLMRRYNKEKAFMYNTYQVVLLSTPDKLASHLVTAHKEGFIPGVKIVRGAYRSYEPAGALTKTKEETDQVYDGVIDALLKRKWNSILKAPAGYEGKPVPEHAVMLATHNDISIQKALSIRREQASTGQPMVECSYAQLQGMADEISCELAQASNAIAAGEKNVDRPRSYKCATWGTLEQCMNFLMRRAYENQDAMGRTKETQRAMGSELMRRWKAGVGLS